MDTPYPVRFEGLYGHPVGRFSGRSPCNRVDRGPVAGSLGTTDRLQSRPGDVLDRGLRDVDGWSMAMAMVFPAPVMM